MEFILSLSPIIIQIQMGGVQYAGNYLVDKVQGSP